MHPPTPKPTITHLHFNLSMLRNYEQWKHLDKYKVITKKERNQKHLDIQVKAKRK
jgi:hypothetical protein